MRVFPSLASPRPSPFVTDARPFLLSHRHARRRSSRMRALPSLASPRPPSFVTDARLSSALYTAEFQSLARKVKKSL
jgi:hypothetical protein